MLSDLIAKSLLRFIERSSSSSRSRQDHHVDDHFLLTIKHLNPAISSPPPPPRATNVVDSLLHQLYSLDQRHAPTTTAYLHSAKRLADQLAAAGRPTTPSEFNTLVLRGLRPEFRDIAVALAARPGPLSFPELHSFLLSHEFIHDGTTFNYHHRVSCYDHDQDRGFVISPAAIICQLCSGPGHTATSCRRGLLKHDHNKHTNSLNKDGDDDRNHSSTVDSENSSISVDDFPQGFVFGVATSSYQFEGAAAKGGRGLGVWDIFTKFHNLKHTHGRKLSLDFSIKGKLI